MRPKTVALMTGLAIALAFALPVAANQVPRTGDQINLFDPPATMAANQPFWVGHGWCSTADDDDPLRLVADPRSRVELAVDGTPVTTGTDFELDVSIADGVTCVAFKVNYHNFRSGLAAGDHTLSGCWYLLGELRFCRDATVTFA